LFVNDLYFIIFKTNIIKTTYISENISPYDNENNLPKKDIPTFIDLTLQNNSYKASTNLKFVIQLEAPIISYKIDSIEQYDDVKNNDYEVIITLSRLTKDASISIKMWTSFAIDDVNVKMVDDNAYKEVLNENNVILNIIKMFLFSVLILTTTIILMKKIKITPLLNENCNLKEKIKMKNLKISNLENENTLLTSKIEQEDNENTNIDEIVIDIENIIQKYKDPKGE